MRFSLIIILIYCFSCQPKHDLPITTNLADGWEFKSAEDSVWRTATVPGNVHSDLLDHGIIDDPFVNSNEQKVQWVSNKNWEYQLNFTVDSKTLKRKHIELNFEGLDTYASVFLNGNLILKTKNAFLGYKINTKSILKETNELKILFESTAQHEESEKAKLPYSLPEGNRIFTRKAQFQYGWDWGPRLNTSGIWRPVKLVAWNDFKIMDASIDIVELTDSLCNLVARIEYKSDVGKDIVYEIYVNDSLSAKKELRSVNSNHEVPFQIDTPKRWWPHNIGKPYLYDIKVLAKKGNKVLDSISMKKGLRTVELVTEKVTIGESFYFKVNDVPVYAKGANYIPQHSLQNKVTNANYEQLLSDVVGANMNMLRVWGGGIYENDTFYNLCDKKGILVWQDFMFACAMYPGDSAFLKNVEQEARYNIKRLRNHASIALWCGNNESSEGWHRWGWQEGRSEAEKEEIWNNYLKVFNNILPKAVAQLTNVDYWESSPKYGRGNPNYQLIGDAHDWWVWHDGYPFEHFEDNVPRFMSEFGFQSYPNYEAIQYISQDDSIDITSDGFKNHQKHHRGFQLIDEYMHRDFPVPDNPEDYVYVSQLLQAYGIAKSIAAHRRAKPYNMGTLYWQLNDCWPGVSWSSIDFKGQWKALHYKVKHHFENVVVSTHIQDRILKTHLINDSLSVMNGSLTIRILDFEGKELWHYVKNTSIGAGTSELKHELNLDSLNLHEDEVVVVSKFDAVESYYYLVKPKDLKLRKADITKRISKIPEGLQIELESSTLQKDIFLYTDQKGYFSNNYFDLMPGKKAVVRFITEADKHKPLQLQLKTLNMMINEF